MAAYTPSWGEGARELVRNSFEMAAFSTTTLNETDALSLHDLNKPVSPGNWTVIVDRGFSTDGMNTFNDQQAEQPLSARQVMEDALWRAKGDLEFIYSQKLNYLALDTLDGSQDSVIKLLADPAIVLNNATLMCVGAYAAAGYYDRAFAFADSLAGIAEYEQIMQLQQVMLELDTAYDKLYKINRDSYIRNMVETFAADTTRPGCWWARALLHQVDGIDMRYMFAPMDFSSERKSRIGDISQQENEVKVPDLADAIKGGLSIYPNPAGNSFKLRYTSAEKGACTMIIRDILGKLISNSVIDPNTVYEISTTELNQGIYFISLIQGQLLAGKQKLVILK